MFVKQLINKLSAQSTTNLSLPNPVGQRIVLMALMIVGLSCVHSSVLAEEDAVAKLTAHQVAEDVKNQLVSVIRKKAELEAAGGEVKYFGAVENVLVPVVDFGYIARGVMGEYGKQASDDQKQRFATNFQRGLVSTYAKGLAGYGNHEITVVPPEGDVTGKKSQSVVLQVRGGDTTNVLAFTMKLNRNSEWKLTNMILNGINLGKTFRNQFVQSMNKSGDLNAVIDGWAN